MNLNLLVGGESVFFRNKYHFSIHIAYFHSMQGVQEFIEGALANVKYSFTWSELTKYSPKSSDGLRNELARLISKKKVMSLRRGFYLIIPPQYQGFQNLPISLYIDHLFKTLNKPYYLSFYSAASYHGATHQAVQKDYVITMPPSMRNIGKGTIRIDFYSTTDWPQKNIIHKKSDTGYFNVSSPALTAIDLVHYQSKIGGLNRIFTVLEELSEEITAEEVRDLLSWYPHTSAIQRLGYLLQEAQADELAEIIETHLSQRTIYPVSLSTEKTKERGKLVKPFKVHVNVEPESDL